MYGYNFVEGYLYVGLQVIVVVKFLDVVLMVFDVLKVIIVFVRIVLFFIICVYN